MYKIKGVATRVSAMAAAGLMLGGVITTALPGAAFADALNPLTERSLMLSSSSPGWAFTDGSGNGTFAQPGSGANGQKTEETFSFKVSTDSTSNTVKGITFQYCTTPAGNCTPPGDGTGGGQSNLDLVYSSPVEGGGGDFQVKVGGTTFANATANTGWAMATSRVVDAAGATVAEKNFITLTNASAGLSIAPGTLVWVRFKASATDYITNPGSDAFFVKINDYNDDATLDNTTLLDGGVTVANVMNESIHITTKVLETMAFSVGTTNPDTEVLTSPDTHGACDPITVNDQIQLGDSAAEYSLSFNEAFDAHSYWRLSTNSSGGASVYYAGETLNNTVGDDINPIGTTKAKAHYGTEQFGLAITNDTDDVIDTAGGAVTPSLLPLVAQVPYDEGNGTIDQVNWTNNTAKFAFTDASDFEPELIAQYTASTIDCSTAKMRYIADIAPNTPAGVYTTKINYIAAPQY